MSKEYFVNKIKTTFFKGGQSECHGEFKLHGQVEFEGEINELKQWCIKRARVNKDYEGTIVMTVFYFETYYELEDYYDSLQEALYDKDFSYVDDPREISWIL